MSLFNLSVLNEFIEAYSTIRKLKSKDKAENDTIDKKCIEIKSDFAAASDDADKWIDIILKLGETADKAQNQKTINQIPSILRAAVSYLTETQSDLSMNFHALRRFLLNTILNKKFETEPKIALQAQFRQQLHARIQVCDQQRSDAYAAWFETHNQSASTQAEVDAKKTAYFQSLKSLAYLGELSHVFDRYDDLFPTFDRPQPNALGGNTKDPLQMLNSRQPWVLHENYDHYYIHKIMQPSNRDLINSLMNPTKVATPRVTPLATLPCVPSLGNDIPAIASIVDPIYASKNEAANTEEEQAAITTSVFSSSSSPSPSTNSTVALLATFSPARAADEIKEATVKSTAPLPTKAELVLKHGISKNAAKKKLAELQAQQAEANTGKSQSPIAPSMAK